MLAAAFKPGHLPLLLLLFIRDTQLPVFPPSPLSDRIVLILPSPPDFPKPGPAVWWPATTPRRAQPSCGRVHDKRHPRQHPLGRGGLGLQRGKAHQSGPPVQRAVHGALEHVRVKLFNDSCSA